jgi:hypothetical protein
MISTERTLGYKTLGMSDVIDLIHRKLDRCDENDDMEKW